MVYRSASMLLFEFVTISSLRAAQLMRGSTPRVSAGAGRATVIAQREVAAGLIFATPRPAHRGARGPMPRPELERLHSPDSGRVLPR